MKPWCSGCLFVFVLGVLAACSSGDQDRVLVMAASSLRDAFQEIEVAFEAANPSIDVQLNLAGSSALREQIFDGAQADVFASASELTMQQVIDEVGVVGDALPFATNELALVVPAGNPGKVERLQDLARQDLLVGLCAAEVPCGSFARDALAQVDVSAAIDTDEPNVRSLLGKVIAGELDAAIVYASDLSGVQPAQVISLPMPESINLDIVYPIAQLSGATNSDDAQAFVAFVLSEDGRAILATHGFGTP